MSEQTPAPSSIDLPLITQSLIAVLMTATVCYMLAAQLGLPDLLSTMFGLVLGYYFGQRSSASVMRQTAVAYEAATLRGHVR